jgi:hypothetical protein
VSGNKNIVKGVFNQKKKKKTVKGVFSQMKVVNK